MNTHATQRGAVKTRIGLALAVVLVGLIAVGPAQAARRVGRYQPVSAPVVASALAGANIAIAQGARHVGKAVSSSAAGIGAGVSALVAMAALLGIGVILALTSRPLAAASSGSSVGSIDALSDRSSQHSTLHAA